MLVKTHSAYRLRIQKFMRVPEDQNEYSHDPAIEVTTTERALCGKKLYI